MSSELISPQSVKTGFTGPVPAPLPIKPVNVTNTPILIGGRSPTINLVNDARPVNQSDGFKKAIQESFSFPPSKPSRLMPSLAPSESDLKLRKYKRGDGFRILGENVIRATNYTTDVLLPDEALQEAIEDTTQLLTDPMGYLNENILSPAGVVENLGHALSIAPYIMGGFGAGTVENVISEIGGDLRQVIPYGDEIQDLGSDALQYITSKEFWSRPKPKESKITKKIQKEYATQYDPYKMTYSIPKI